MGELKIREDEGKFHDLFLLDITWETPFLTDLSKYDLSKYENLVY
jgi:hypothetical protein